MPNFKWARRRLTFFGHILKHFQTPKGTHQISSFSQASWSLLLLLVLRINLCSGGAIGFSAGHLAAQSGKSARGGTSKRRSGLHRIVKVLSVAFWSHRSLRRNFPPAQETVTVSPIFFKFSAPVTTYFELKNGASVSLWHFCISEKFKETLKSSAQSTLLHLYKDALDLYQGLLLT